MDGQRFVARPRVRSAASRRSARSTRAGFDRDARERGRASRRRVRAADFEAPRNRAACDYALVVVGVTKILAAEDAEPVGELFAGPATLDQQAFEHAGGDEPSKHVARCLDGPVGRQGAVSARTGDGIQALRGMLAERVAERVVAVTRLAADVGRRAPRLCLRRHGVRGRGRAERAALVAALWRATG